MAGIATQGGGSNKKAVDHEIPLVPFIDLLLCCVMFLLATAVWTHLSSLEANQQIPGERTEDAEVTPPAESLILQVHGSGFLLASTAGDRMEIPMAGDEYDYVGLRQRLSERRELAPDVRDIMVAPEDGVSYEQIIGAMDVVHGAGFQNVSLGSGAML